MPRGSRPTDRTTTGRRGWIGHPFAMPGRGGWLGWGLDAGPMTIAIGCGYPLRPGRLTTTLEPARILLRQDDVKRRK